MADKPVFRSRFEASLWKRLGPDGAPPGRGEAFSDAAGNILRHDGPVHSSILVRVMRGLLAAQSTDLRVLLPQLASKARPSDCAPALAAALMLLDLGDQAGARAMLDSAPPGRDVPFSSCVKARILMAEGESQKAKRELMRARCSDPVFPMFYELIQQMEPSEGWMHRRNIELLARGMDPVPCGESGRASPAESLYEIYRDWHGGRRDRATAAMIASEEHGKRNPEYVLASARMSMDESDWHSAQRMYGLLMSKSSNCTYIICETARSHLMGGGREKALSLYLEAEKLDPSSPMVLNGLAQAYSAMGMRDEAAAAILELLDGEHALLEEHYAGAKALMSMSRYAEAAEIVGRILESYPDEPGAYVLKSEMDLARGNAAAALETITEGSDRNPRDVGCRIQKAKALFKTGRIDKAEKELDRAAKADPGNMDALILMRDIAAASGRQEEAVRLSREILERDPSNEEAMNAVSRAALSSKGADAPYSEYRDMLAEDGRADNFINVLSSLVADGRHADAARLCAEKEREFGGLAMVRRLRGNAEYAMGEYRKASASFASAASLDPESAVLWHSKGMADEAGGDLEAAEEAFNKAVLLDMNEPAYWISRAAVQEKRGRMAAAVDSLNRAIELSPGSAYALARKAAIFAGLGRLSEAACLAEMSMATDPGSMGAARIRMGIAVMAGDRELAYSLSRDMIRRSPQGSAEEAAEEAIGSLAAADMGREALALADEALSRDPGSMPLLTLKKELCFRFRDPRGAADACRRILAARPDSSLVRRELADALAASGDVDEADRIYSDLGREEARELATAVKPRKKATDQIKRQSERALRRAYVSRSPLTDGDLMQSLDIDGDTAAAVLEYLSDIKEYGDVVPGSPEFERMEKLSMNAVSRGGFDPDSDPVAPLPCAFVAGGAKDADEAKELVAYIYKVMTMDARGGRRGQGSVAEISKKSRVGVYGAREERDGPLVNSSSSRTS